MSRVAGPLFRDPLYDGAADPTVIWSHKEGAWFMFYTARRANLNLPGFAWVHGTDIGIATSHDAGRTWLYRGTAQGLPIERGTNTFWAPEIIEQGGQYHMYVSYVRGIPLDWSGERHILYYTSLNLWDWHFRSQLTLSSDYVIDACVYTLPGGWRMWYKDEAAGAHTYAADSSDLLTWRVIGPVITDVPHEGPNVFAWRGAYWMVTDIWSGLGVYRSLDLHAWQRQANILDKPGQRADDGACGRHADVVVQGDLATIFYFVHPDEHAPQLELVHNVIPYAKRRSSIQAAILTLAEDGVSLRCDRDQGSVGLHVSLPQGQKN